MIATTDFKKGKKIEIDGDPCEILDFQHFKPGKGGAFMRTKWRNLLTGSVVEKNFRAGTKFSEPDVETKEMQYLYNDGSSYVFMDLTTYEQISVEDEVLAGKGGYIKDGQTIKVMNYQGRPIDMEIPLSVVLEVTSTDPGLKGDTVSGASKPATLETGLTVNVPLFINEGDKIKVDTRNGEYQGREN